MAKKIRKANTGTAAKIHAMVDGEKVTVSTKKRCVGKPMLDEKKCQACINHPTSLVALVCCTKAGLDKIEKKAKGTRTSKRPFASAICMWIMGEDKAAVTAMAIKNGCNDKAAARFANDIFSVGNAAIGKARKKTGLIATYMAWAIYGEGDEPTGCKATIGFCKPFAAEFKKLTI